MPERDAVILRGDGVLDLCAAERLVGALAEVRAAAPVELDLTRVREFHDLGVMLLARALAARGGARVRGLGQHHVRLLRYLGIDTGEPELRLDADPA